MLIDDIKSEDEFKVKVLFGAIDLATNKWHPNPFLKMPEEQQRQHNFECGLITANDSYIKPLPKL